MTIVDITMNKAQMSLLLKWVKEKYKKTEWVLQNGNDVDEDKLEYNLSVAKQIIEALEVGIERAEAIEARQESIPNPADR